MMTKADAIAAVRKALPSDWDVFEDEVLESEHGWLVFSQTKRFIDTQDPKSMAFGSGGTIVDKRTGGLIRLGSRYPPEVHLQIYEAGYLAHDDFDLVVTAVADPVEAVGLLEALGIAYAVPQVEHGRVWRIPRAYSQRQLHDRIRDLPCRFKLGSLYFRWTALERLKQSPSVEFVLEANAGFRNGI